MSNTMTQEQLIATFGQEVGTQMFKQMNASSGGGNQAPFTFVKKVATHGSELGAFGDFCINVKTEKQADGTRTVTDKGENLGNAFEFVIVNVSYKYRRWDEVKQKTIQSNMFETLDGIKTAVEVHTGVPLPGSKEAKKKAEWKLVRVNAGLIRKNSKSDWTPAIWETDGTMYFTLGEVVGNQPNGGLLSGIVKVATKLDSKGATQFSVIDVEKSKFVELPKDFFTMPILGEITTKMTEYRNHAQYEAGADVPAQAAPAQATPAESDDNVNW